MNTNDTALCTIKSSNFFKHEKSSEEKNCGLDFEFQEAQRHIKENNFGFAFEIYERILKLDPSNCEQNKALLYEMAQISYDLSWNLSTGKKFICRYLDANPHCSKAKALKETIDLKLKEKISRFNKQNDANEELQRNWDRFDKSFKSVVIQATHNDEDKYGQNIKKAEPTIVLKKPIHIDTAAITNVKRLELSSKVDEKPILTGSSVMTEREKVPETVNQTCIKPKTVIDSEGQKSNYTSGNNKPNYISGIKKDNILYKTEINFMTKINEKTNEQPKKVVNLNHITQCSYPTTVNTTPTYAAVTKGSSNKNYVDIENTHSRYYSRTQEANVKSKNNHKNITFPEMNEHNASSSKNQKDDKNSAKPKKRSFLDICKFW